MPETTPVATTTPEAPTPEATTTPVTAAPEATPKEAPKEPGTDDAKLAADILNRDWTADLPDDLKETGKRFTSKADAVRAINDFRKRESQVRVPGKNASPEEIATYHKAIGIPEKPEEYEFSNLPEGMELTEEVKASRAEWGKRFQTLGIPKETAKEISKLANEDALQELTAQKKADEAFVASQEAALRSEWKGEEYDRNKTLANRAFTELANRTGLKLDDLTQIETKDGRLLMDRAEIVRMFAAIGREMVEGSLGPSLTESEKDTVDDQIRGVREQVAEAQSVGDSKRANKLYLQEQALIAKREGSKAIVGARGRMV
jgi:DNA repair exonuclease SbcCD nuclease subunit